MGPRTREGRPCWHTARHINPATTHLATPPPRHPTQVKHTYIRSYFLFSRSRLAAKGTVQLEGLGLEGGDAWREVEISMDWLRKGHEALEQVCVCRGVLLGR